jgi:hypothetical protein
MTPDEFREMALGFPGALEGAHMHHPDFRAHGRIFATLGYPDETTGMVKLTPEDQKRILELHGHAFFPAEGSWGLQGCTMVRLAAVKEDVLAQAMDLAWQRSASPQPRAAKNVSARKSTTRKASARGAID